VSETG